MISDRRTHELFLMVVKILSKSLLKLVFIKSIINSFHFDGFDQTKTPLESWYFSLSKLINESVLLVLNMAACHMSPLFLINSPATQFKASEGRTKKSWLNTWKKA